MIEGGDSGYEHGQPGGEESQKENICFVSRFRSCEWILVTKCLVFVGGVVLSLLVG